MSNEILEYARGGATELTLTDISAYLGQLAIGKTGKAFIIETNGDLVATSEQIETMKDGVNRLPAGEADDPWIATVSGELASNFENAIESFQTWGAPIMIDDQPMRILVSRYENRRNLEWLIVTVVPDSDFLADIEANRAQSTWIGAMAVVLMVAGSVLVVFLMLKPILALSAHARRISEGHLDETLELSDSHVLRAPVPKQTVGP